MYSTGRAESMGRESMFKKSADGSMSLKTSVEELGALTPVNAVPVSYASMAGTVSFTLEKPLQ